jgi:DNA helicase-2/ATP-dependent DNA helicase PcrA
MNPAELASERAIASVFASLDRGENFLLEAGPGAGKTFSLVKALQRLIERKRVVMPRRHQRIACITFTNVAKDEIEARTEKSPIIYCDTIHGFCWSLIGGFQKQLREELPLLGDWPGRLEEAGVKAIGIVEYALGHRRVAADKVTIGHDDVLLLAIAFLAKPKFRRIMADRFPLILIDEYQDANAGWMDSLKAHMFGTAGGPQIGLFGDHWQKIYGDGCGRVQHPSLIPIPLNANFRSCPAIVASLNRMRPELPQDVVDPNAPGSVVVFHTNNWPEKRLDGPHWKGDLPPEAAHLALTKTKAYLSEQGWDLGAGPTKILMLTHRVLAAEQGYGTFPGVFRFNEAFAKKEDVHVAFFVDKLEPACDALEAKKYGEMLAFLEQGSPPIKDPADKARWSDVMQKLTTLRSTGTVAEVLAHLRSTGLPILPEAVLDRERKLERLLQTKEELPSHIDELKKLHSVPYSEVKALRAYLDGHSPFETNHGVKGAEFENVLVVVGRGWNRYNFCEMLELVPSADSLSSTKREAFERNRNLFYVACSRPKRRLAVLFTQVVSQEAMATLHGWFGAQAVKPLSQS